MSFKYSCIGDNTKENREHLEKVGYEKHFLDRESDPLVHTWESGGFSSLPIDSVWNPYHTEYSNVEAINCIGNPELFQAVTAIRDTSDYMQWFTDGKEWILCLGDNFCEWYYSLGKYLTFSLDTIHKATLSELQEHFKKKE